jgi:16S rRNA (cytosine967-C5)-methyltransferase
MSAAIDLIDRIFDGELADRALAGWGRQNRYAGSKDRAAIADLVYDVLRRKRSLAALGGSHTGRGLFLGYMRDAGQDPDTVFGAGTYGPAALSDAERSAGQPPQHDSSESADMPDWLWPDLQASLGDQVHTIADAMRHRAPIHLRVNLGRISRQDAIADLSAEGIIARPHPLSPSAVEVLEGARKIRNASMYLNGKVELQDASSQAVADMVPLAPGETLLDFCAGGGGKILAVAGRVDGAFFAHDVDPKRMKDLPARAARAQAVVNLVSLADIPDNAPFDTVLIDAPCSGSGSWRRDPQGKWLLTPEKLRQTIDTQHEILDQSAAFVRSQGHLVYATCSVLDRENRDQVDAFLSRHSAFSRVTDKSFSPLGGGDGFYCAVLRRD